MCQPLSASVLSVISFQPLRALFVPIPHGQRCFADAERAVPALRERLPDDLQVGKKCSADKLRGILPLGTGAGEGIFIVQDGICKAGGKIFFGAARVAKAKELRCAKAAISGSSRMPCSTVSSPNIFIGFLRRLF